MDTNTILILAGVLITGFVILGLFITKKLENLTPKEDNASLLMLNQNLQGMFQGMQERVDEALRHSSTSAQTIIKDVTEKLTKLDETNKQVVNFSSQLQNLQDILNNPKQRGIFGEYSLELLLKNAFSPSDYQMQYSLGKDEKTGKDLIVDAVLFVGDKKIPIDSKFSLENYAKIISEKDSVEKTRLEKAFKQDLKNRIDETSKYIQPGKGTFDFAFMFIPAEGIFYDLLVSKVGSSGVNARDLLTYATCDKKVHIVSPTTFYAALQSTLQGMRAYQIQESTKQIIANVGQLGIHLKAYEDYYKKLGGHISTVVSSYSNGAKEFKKIDKDITRITGSALDVDLPQLDKPSDIE